MGNTSEKIQLVGKDSTAAAFKSVQANAKKLEKEGRRLQTTFSGLGPVITGVFTGVAVRGVVRTVVAFEKLEASLRTVEGTAERATATFDFLKEFSSKTPFQLEELTASYIKLKALGLDPTEQSLRSFGNTASAMGKTLDQFVEAVADAVTGEFERLKEFGIKARSEGDNVAFTFQGMTTTIGKNATEIEDYLRAIGENQFAGAMEQQMDTLGGAFSNLQDSVSMLSNAIGEAGFSNVLKGASTLIGDFTTEITTMVTELGSGASAVDVLSGAFSRLFMGDELKQLTRELDKEQELIKKIQTLKANLERGGQPNQGLSGERGRANRFARGEQEMLAQMEKDLELTQAKIAGLQNIVTEQADQHAQNQLLIEDQNKKAEAQSALNNELAKEAVLLDKKKEEKPLFDDGDPVLNALADREWERMEEQFEAMEKQGTEAMETISEASQEMGQDLIGQFSFAFQSMEDTIADFVTSGKFRFNDFIGSIMDGFARLAVRQAITGPLESMFSNVLNSFGGPASALTSVTGLGGELLGTIPQRRAMGGPVTAGRPYIVGENEPELFVPRQSGQIVPGHKMGGNSPINVTNTFVIQSDGGRISRESQAQVAARAGDAIERAVRRNR